MKLHKPSLVKVKMPNFIVRKLQYSQESRADRAQSKNGVVVRITPRSSRLLGHPMCSKIALQRTHPDQIPTMKTSYKMEYTAKSDSAFRTISEMADELGVQ